MTTHLALAVCKLKTSIHILLKIYHLQNSHNILKNLNAH